MPTCSPCLGWLVIKYWKQKDVGVKLLPLTSLTGPSQCLSIKISNSVSPRLRIIKVYAAESQRWLRLSGIQI